MGKARPYGSGSVREVRPGVWRVEAVAGRRSDGARRRMSRTVHGSKADAELELVRLRSEMGQSPNVGDEMTLDEYFEGVFVTTRAKLLTSKTLRTYESVYRCHIKDDLGWMRAADITRPVVQRWVLGLPSAACARKAFTHLRAILRAMWDDELLDEKPLERSVRLPRHQPAPKDVWDADEVTEALSRLQGHRLEALVLVMAGGGVRREEALALDLPGDLEFSTVTGFQDGRERVVCRFIVREAWVDGDEQRPTTKTYRVRPVTIGEPFAPRLREVISDGRPKLLMTLRGGPMQPSSVPETWRRAFGPKGPLNGMRFVELRTLRHSHETIAARAGVDGAVNADLHGHTYTVMRQNYLSLVSDDADRLAEAVRASIS